MSGTFKGAVMFDLISNQDGHAVWVADRGPDGRAAADSRVVVAIAFDLTNRLALIGRLTTGGETYNLPTFMC